MFCTKCGKPLNEGQKFCTGCGTPVPGAAPKPAAVKPAAPKPVAPKPATAKPAAAKPAPKPAAPKKKGNGGLIVVIIILLILLLAAVGCVWYLLSSGGSEDSDERDDRDRRSPAPSAVEATLPAAAKSPRPDPTGDTRESYDPYAMGAPAAPSTAPSVAPSVAPFDLPVVDPFSDPTGYILDTDTRYLVQSELLGYDKDQVRLIRNEIYARHGYSFNAQDLRDYFGGKSWYVENPSVNANTFGLGNMNEFERANVELIQGYERSMGW